MSAALLRDAAALMRKRAAEASASPWSIRPELDGIWAERKTVVHSGTGFGTRVVSVGQTRQHQPNAEQNVEHIASWHPAVALAVADLLDLAVTHQVAFTPEPRARLVAIARAYLGRSS